jgi:hypothetical protein
VTVSLQQVAGAFIDRVHDRAAECERSSGGSLEALAVDYYGPAPGISAFIATRFTAIFVSWIVVAEHHSSPAPERPLRLE